MTPYAIVTGIVSGLVVAGTGSICLGIAAGFALLLFEPKQPDRPAF